MHSRQIKFNIILLIIVLFASACSNNRKGTKSVQPNVLIILADDLGYGDVSCYGNKDFSTPNIDKIASQGALFTDFYVPTPYCAPSRATLLTGRFPLKHGLIRNPTPDSKNPEYRDVGLSPDEFTLAELFGEANYETMCIGKWHLGHYEEFFPVNQGFDNYYGILYSNDMRPVQIIENRDTVEYPVDQNYLTQNYTEKALSFLRENSANPFFLHLCHAMPHKPLAASDKFYTPETPGNLYEDVINELDWSVGRIFDELKKLDILDNTIVIVMSDNGPWYGGSTGGLKGMKATAWEGGVRVPFILHYPKIFKESKTIDVPCWSADIFPTLLSLTGIDYKNVAKLDGEDISEIIKGTQTEHKPIFGMLNNTIRSIRKDDWKLFVQTPKQYQEVALENWSDPRGPDGETILAPYEQSTPADYPGLKPIHSGNEIQLYNLKEDPAESVDLAAEHPEKVKELMEMYVAFKQEQEESK